MQTIPQLLWNECRLQWGKEQWSGRKNPHRLLICHAKGFFTLRWELNDLLLDCYRKSTLTLRHFRGADTRKTASPNSSRKLKRPPVARHHVTPQLNPRKDFCAPPPQLWIPMGRTNKSLTAKCFWKSLSAVESNSVWFIHALLVWKAVPAWIRKKKNKYTNNCQGQTEDQEMRHQTSSRIFHLDHENKKISLLKLTEPCDLFQANVSDLLLDVSPCGAPHFSFCFSCCLLF